MYRRSSHEHPLTSLTGLYYSLKSDKLVLPEDLSSREFAFQLYGSNKYIRHLSFRTREEVVEWIKDGKPHSAYYSSAIYEIPDAPKMNEKGWLGAELQLDIDIDHIDQCGGMLYEICNNTVLFREECITRSLEAALESVEILRDNFGLRDIEIVFSGNRGFHVHAHDKDILHMDNELRREISDYLQGIGLDLKVVFPRRRGLTPFIPSREEPGWRGRLVRKALEMYNRSDLQDVPFEKFFWSNLDNIAKSSSIPIDSQVTVDVTRLIRIPGSLNGKSGLIVEKVTEELKEYTLKDFSPFRGSLKILPVCNMEVEFGGSWHKFSRNITYRVEGALGVFLIFKSLAKLVDWGDVSV
ncbi:MAG: hypothetical protein LRS47_03525 [Desulfurococcales archaeon]|nr:hypothetical protein [Desulfurococcales archaeon]